MIRVHTCYDSAVQINTNRCVAIETEVVEHNTIYRTKFIQQLSAPSVTDETLQHLVELLVTMYLKHGCTKRLYGSKPDQNIL